MTINERPNTESKSFVEVQVTRIGEHEHAIFKKPALRGEKRVEVAKECISLSNGSASAYVDGIVGECMLAGEPIKPNVSTDAYKATVRKAVFEMHNEQMVSSCWITNVQYVADTSRALLDGKKLKGYVQRFDVSRLKKQASFFGMLLRI
jgi:hypothetical protein